MRSHDIHLELRKKLDAQIKEFLKSGGLIQQIPENYPVIEYGGGRFT